MMVSPAHMTLANGLQVVAIEQPHLHSASFSFMVRCGSRHESEQQWGLSHLLEHMLFRGTAQFPDSRALARAFERSGGTLDASTWRDHTCLSATVQPQKLSTALGVLAEMIGRPRFSDLEIERDIVEQELQSDLDANGHDIDLNNMSRAEIWRDHPMGRRIVGSVESLRSFTRGDVEQHHARNYVGSNAVLCVAGKVSSNAVHELAAEALGILPKGAPACDGDAARFAATRRLQTYPYDAAQLALQLTFEALPDSHVDFPALVLLTRLLDDGVGSLLQEAVCARRGLIYELSTGLDCYADCGLYDIEMKVSPRRAATALQVTLETLHALCVDPVNEEDLNSVRERCLHELECSEDSGVEMAAHFATAQLFKRSGDLTAEAARLARVSPQDIRRVARGVFLTHRIHTTIMGPTGRANTRRIEKLLEGFPKGEQSGIRPALPDDTGQAVA